MLDVYREDEKCFQLDLEEYQPLELHNLILSCVSKGTPGNIGKLPLEWLDICLASKREMMSYVKKTRIESGPLWNTVVLTRYNFSVVPRQSSFHTAL
jgi:hypothetical protein